MRAYGKSWDYNIYDCRYCLYWKGKKQGCVYPDGCCCPIDQRDAFQFRDDEDKENTAQQTLDYLQSLYEKKLCTYPRTDSRYLTDDMEDSVNPLVLLAAGICGTEPPSAVIPAQVCNSKKVSDHHAIVPTMAGGEADLSALPAGEREILLLISRQVLMAVSESFVYKETIVKMECGGNEFTAKGKALLRLGWRAFAEKEQQDKTIPALSEGQAIPVSSCDRDEQNKS